MPNALKNGHGLLHSDPFTSVKPWKEFENLVEAELAFLNNRGKCSLSPSKLDCHLELAKHMNEEGQTILKNRMRGSFMPGQIEIKCSEVFPKRIKVIAHLSQANDNTGIPDFYIYDVKSAYCKTSVITRERMVDGRPVRERIRNTWPKRFVHTECMVSMHVHDNEVPEFEEDNGFFNSLTQKNSARSEKSYALKLIRQLVNYMVMHEVKVGFIATDFCVRFLCLPFDIQAEPTGVKGGDIWISKCYLCMPDYSKDENQSPLLGYMVGILSACIRGSEMWPGQKIRGIHLLLNEKYFKAEPRRLGTNKSTLEAKILAPLPSLASPHSSEMNEDSTSDKTANEFESTLIEESSLDKPNASELAAPKVSELFPNLADLAQMHQALVERLEESEEVHPPPSYQSETSDTDSRFESQECEDGSSETSELTELKKRRSRHPKSRRFMPVSMRPPTPRWPVGKVLASEELTDSEIDQSFYETALSDFEENSSNLNTTNTKGRNVNPSSEIGELASIEENDSSESATTAGEIDQNNTLINSLDTIVPTPTNSTCSDDSSDDTILNLGTFDDKDRRGILLEDSEKASDLAAEQQKIEDLKLALERLQINEMQLPSVAIVDSSDGLTPIAKADEPKNTRGPFSLIPEFLTTRFPDFHMRSDTVVTNVMVELCHKKNDWYNMCSKRTLCRNNGYVPASLRVTFHTPETPQITHSYEVVIKRCEYSHSHKGMIRLKHLAKELMIYSELEARNMAKGSVPKLYCFGDVWNSHKMMIMEPWGRVLREDDMCKEVMGKMKKCLECLHSSNVLLIVFHLEVFGIAPDSSIRIVDLRYAQRVEKVTKKAATEEMLHLENLLAKYTDNESQMAIIPAWNEPAKTLKQKILSAIVCAS